jgi:hypothetical protein
MRSIIEGQQRGNAMATEGLFGQRTGTFGEELAGFEAKTLGIEAMRADD